MQAPTGGALTRDRTPGIRTPRSRSRTVKLRINGQDRDVPNGLTVTALLEHLQLTSERVAVEVNAEVVRRARHPEIQLSEGDQIEIVTFVGGG